MLYARIKSMGYNGDLYNELQDKEYQAAKYRSSSKISYSYKYGRYAIMEMYGWLLLNGRIEKEYQNTFRTSIIDIDPSAPTISPMRTYTSKCFLPNDIYTLNQWLKSSDIEYMKSQLKVKLPKCDGEWILLKGRFNQKIEERYADLYLSATGQIVPVDTEGDEIIKFKNEPLTFHHAFAGEIGWRTLTATDEYISDNITYLLAQYSFSTWDTTRFKYKNFYLLNPEISNDIGLTFNINDMAYYFGNDKISVHYINDTDHFFFMRKDIIDIILRKYNAKLWFDIYERRMVDLGLPEELSIIENKYIQNRADAYYCCDSVYTEDEEE